MDLLLITVVSLIVLSGLDAHMWPQPTQRGGERVAKLTEVERTERGRQTRERARLSGGHSQRAKAKE